jgi:hypothetical protein
MRATHVIVTAVCHYQPAEYACRAYCCRGCCCCRPLQRPGAVNANWLRTEGLSTPTLVKSDNWKDAPQVGAVQCSAVGVLCCADVGVVWCVAVGVLCMYKSRWV